jgi:hypothetical protein
VLVLSISPDDWHGNVLEEVGYLSETCTLVVWRDPSTRERSLEGQFRGDQFAGARLQATGPTPVELHRAASPDCSVGGRWKRFSHPSWPITFDYPSTWFLSATQDQIFLACPSTDQLRWGMESIYFDQGAGPDSLTDAPATYADGFQRIGRRWWWKTSSEPCSDSGGPAVCAPARQVRRSGMQVVGAEVCGERVCEMDVLFLKSSWWVRVSSRGLGDFEPPEPGASDRLSFDGDGVFERVMRSIRPR